MKTLIRTFKYENNDTLRVMKMNSGRIWFVCADVAKALSLGNYNRLVRNNTKRSDWRMAEMKDGNSSRRMMVINLKALVEMTSLCKGPQGKFYRRWVIDEVMSEMVETKGTELTYVFNPSRRETQTEFFSNGEMKVNLCGFEQGEHDDVLPLEAGSAVKQRGSMVTQTDGTSHFRPFRQTGLHRYESVYRAGHSELKRTKEWTIVSMRFPRTMKSERLLQAIDSEATVIKAHIAAEARAQAADAAHANKPAAHPASHPAAHANKPAAHPASHPSAHTNKPSTKGNDNNDANASLFDVETIGW